MEIEKGPATCDRSYAGTRPCDTETRTDDDTERRKQTNIYMYEQITNKEATTRNGAPVGYNRTGRRTDADACSLQRTKGSRSEVLPEALGRSSKQHEPPRNPAQERAMGQRGGKQREKRPESVRQHFVLSARDPLFFLVLLLL